MPSPVSPRQLTYPEPPRSDIIDELHGVKVADPFRPLEDVDSEATRAWVDAQEKLTSSWLAEQPQREVILERLQSVWNHERFGVPVRRGGRYFYQHNPGLLDQSALYWLEHLDDEPRLLLDPNQLASDGTSALVSWAPSRDGRHLVYGISNAGSDWREWRVRDVATGRDLDDVVRWSKFCEAVWAHDGSGFYYSVYPASVDDNVQATDQLLGQRLMFHRLGSAQSDDEVVYERPEHPTWGYLPVVSDDGRFLVVSIWRGSARVNQVLVRRLDGNDPLAAPFVELMMGFDARYTFIANVENSLLFQTDRDAPRGSVVAVTLDHPDSSAWSIVLPEADDVLESASLVGGNLVACYLRDAASAVRVFTRDGEHRHDLELDDLATAVGFGGTPDDPETFFAMTSFTRPTTIYRYDAASGQHEVWRAPRVDFDPAQFRTRQVFYTSRDGTRVPMFLAHRIDLADGPHPTILYGYGGFDVSLTPAFLAGGAGVDGDGRRLCGAQSARRWRVRCGVARRRDAREEAERVRRLHLRRRASGRRRSDRSTATRDHRRLQWRAVGRRLSHPATRAVRRCLPERRRPRHAPLPSLHDRLGLAEYGDPDQRDDFAVLHRYSPLHRVRAGVAYPSTLIATADHDDRVVPAHGFKFAATLQSAQAGNAPILLRIERRAGHGLGKPTGKLLEEHADRLAFLAGVLDGVDVQRLG